MSGKWGSFFQQAVAGVEARLDNILAEGETDPKASQNPVRPTSTPVRNGGRSSPANTSRQRENLQNRLAKAAAAKGDTPTSTARSSGAFSRSSDAVESSPAECEPGSADYQPRTGAASVPVEDDSSTRTPATAQLEETDRAEGIQDLHKPLVPSPSKADGGLEKQEPAEQAEDDAKWARTGRMVSPHAVDPCSKCASLSARIEHINAQLAASGTNEDFHSYVERVDALESKLRYLSREATDSARKAASAAPAKSVEKRLAEKDEKISLLMSEGQALASTEQKHRALIKRLRAKVADDERITGELRKEKDEAESELDMLRRNTPRTEELEARCGELQALADGLKTEVSSLRLELDDKSSKVEKLEAELERMADEGTSSVSSAIRQESELQLRQISELEETVASLKVEKNLVADRGRARETELRERAELALERERQTKSEMQALESKLEALRIVAEEASAGAVGDSQAKLLRQMETLQSQYATARENWQGIEASLASRVSTLEKERDEATRRESEMRRKAKDSSLRWKHQQEEMQSLQDELPRQKLQVEAFKAEAKSLQHRADAAEAAVSRLRDENETLHKALAKADAERRTQSRPHSPILTGPRTAGTDVLQQGAPRLGPSPTFNNVTPDGAFERPASASRISFPLRLRTSSVSGSTMETPSSQGLPLFETPLEDIAAGHDRSESASHADRVSTPQQAAQDVLSVSTVAAGPSIQLVERMGAGMRRLEAEKVATKEELARISSQRDEARAEIVSLMKEVEANRSSSQRVEELEKEVAAVNSRYQTTLEMLGEKSELVEELQADIQDMKAMYRELVERTVK